MTIPYESRVFSIFSLPEVARTLGGQTLGGVLEDVLDVPRSTLDRRLAKGDMKWLLDRMQESPYDELQQRLAAIEAGEFPYPSLVGGFLLRDMKKIWRDYERSLSLLCRAEQLEFRLGSHFSTYKLESLSKMILGLRVELSQAVPSLGEELGDQISVEIRNRIEMGRERVVQEVFFEILAALDIDACQSSFSGYSPKPLFFLVMPEFDSHPIKRNAIRKPGRKLLDVLFCFVLDMESPAKFEDMIAPYDENLLELVRGRLSRGTLHFDDYLSLMELWWPHSPRYTCGEVVADAAYQRSWTVVSVLYFAARTFELVFKVANKRKDAKLLFEGFYKNYYSAWKSELARRGLVEGQGKAWDDKPSTRIIARSFELV